MSFGGEVAQVQPSDSIVRPCSFIIKDLENQFMLKLKNASLFTIQLDETNYVNLQKLSSFYL